MSSGERHGHVVDSNSGPGIRCPGPTGGEIGHWLTMEPGAEWMLCPRCGASYRMPDEDLSPLAAPSGGINVPAFEPGAADRTDRSGPRP